MSGSLITIIVSTYNRVSALRWCLEALEAQALRDFEVIVVNDGSTNSTAEELQAYARTTPLRLRIFSQQNAGPALGRNLAITHTTTPFALLIGNEGSGLSSELLDRATTCISIPTPGPVESLNAAIAASILLYEAARQRNLS